MNARRREEKGRPEISCISQGQITQIHGKWPSFRAAACEDGNSGGSEERANFNCPSCNLPFLVGIAAFVIHKIDDSCKALRAGWWILAVIVFGVVITIRTRLLGVPLERDEGEYAYAGQLILQGVPPYTLAYNMKFPGIYAAYAAIMSIFGQTITGIHLGLLLVNAATVILIFFLGRQLISSTVGLAAAMSYAVLSVSASVLGFAGHATHFVLLPVLGGTLLLCSSTDRQALQRLFASGLLFGVGLLMKQPAVFFALFGAIYLVCSNLHRRVRAKKVLVPGLTFGAGV